MNEAMPMRRRHEKRRLYRLWRSGAAVVTSLLLLTSCADSAQPAAETPSATSSADHNDSKTTVKLANYPSGFEAIEPTGDIPLLDCSDQTSSRWSRDELANFLIDQKAFNLSYLGNPATLASDIRDYTKTSTELVAVLSEVTQYGYCNDAPFDVLILNTGHPTNTAGGNVSQHSVGYAVDIRPRRDPDGYSVPHYTSPDLNDTEVIADDPKQLTRAERLASFIMSDTIRPHIYQMICIGINPNWDKGGAREDSSWPASVSDYHHDHIHIGVVPSE